MSFFDDSHVTDIGLQGSAGPSVGMWDMVQQSFRQQFRVDSARALDNEIENRWTENLRLLQEIGGQRFEREIDPLNYRRFAQFIRGEPVEALPRRVVGEGYGASFSNETVTPEEQLQNLMRADEAIRQLNNPRIRTFAQILEEVSQMQQEVEAETASMSERSGAVGGTIGSLIGAIGGSFTFRDPLNIITAPFGAGRTAVMRIASEMGLAAVVTGATEYGDVAPARRLAGLSERDPLFNIAAATLGAGLIRGGIEGIGYGARRLFGEDIDFDFRDSQLEQMFNANDSRPTARAGGQILEDVRFIERNNPYGEGAAAQARFMAELQQVQRVMGGEPMTAVARVLPPVPFEYIERQADFQLVKEQAPLLYAKMEVAQRRVEELTRQIDEATSQQPLDLVSAVRLVDEDAAAQLEQLSARVNDEALPEAQRVAADIEGQAIVQRVGIERVNRAVDSVETNKKNEVRNLRASRRAANKEYRTTYRDVETGAIRIRDQQIALEAAQQREALGIFAPATRGRAFNWSALQYDNVAARVDEINAFTDTLDEKAAASFVRETVGEGEEAVEREAWRTEGGIDIGLHEPVDPEFRFATDDGEMTIEAAMRDLQDDADLDEAMRTCLL